jgi:hypothetical protein
MAGSWRDLKEEAQSCSHCSEYDAYCPTCSSMLANERDRLVTVFRQLAHAWEEEFEYRSCKTFPDELWAAVTKGGQDGV